MRRIFEMNDGTRVTLTNRTNATVTYVLPDGRKYVVGTKWFDTNFKKVKENNK